MAKRRLPATPVEHWLILIPPSRSIPIMCRPFAARQAASEQLNCPGQAAAVLDRIATPGGSYGRRSCWLRGSVGPPLGNTSRCALAGPGVPRSQYPRAALDQVTALALTATTLDERGEVIAILRRDSRRGSLGPPDGE